MKLKETTNIRVRFNETDPLGIVWHGNYLKYFEDGREAFGKEFGMEYLDMLFKMIIGIYTKEVL